VWKIETGGKGSPDCHRPTPALRALGGAIFDDTLRAVAHAFPATTSATNP
jgi:hypothetical protein